MCKSQIILFFKNEFFSYINEGVRGTDGGRREREDRRVQQRMEEEGIGKGSSDELKINIKMFDRISCQ